MRLTQSELGLSGTTLHLLSKRLQTREISACNLAEVTLQAIDTQSDINALIACKDRQSILDQAHEADQRLNRKTCPCGWLTGIPIAIKDLDDAAGFPTTQGGCPAFGEAAGEGNPRDREFEYFGNWRYKLQTRDAPYVRRLRDAGAIIIAKTNSPELGMGCHTFNSVHGTTANPADTDLSVGGSSGGIAGAVASGILAGGTGSDMMGSLRNPAGWNSLYSLRPTSGWMEDDGANESEMLLSYPISTVGPIGKSPEDLTLILETIIPDVSLSLFNASDVIDASMDDLDILVGSSNIGWLNDWGGAYPCEEGLLMHCEDALQKFRSKGGASVETLIESPFPNTEMYDAWSDIRSNTILHNIQENLGCSLDEVVPTLESGGAKVEAILECRRGESLEKEKGKHGLAQAVRIAARWRNRADELFETYDFLALPSSQCYPFDKTINWPKSIAGAEFAVYHEWMQCMVPVSLLGVPCVTIPAGIGKINGLPIGVQIFAQRGQDAKLLRLARWYRDNSQ